MKYSSTLLKFCGKAGTRKGNHYKYKELTIHPQAKGHIQNVASCIAVLQVDWYVGSIPYRYMVIKYCLVVGSANSWVLRTPIHIW
jgi:hypothetical protein